MCRWIINHSLRGNRLHFSYLIDWRGRTQTHTTCPHTCERHVITDKHRPSHVRAATSQSTHETEKGWTYGRLKTSKRGPTLLAVNAQAALACFLAHTNPTKGPKCCFPAHHMQPPPLPSPSLLMDSVWVDTSPLNQLRWIIEEPFYIRSWPIFCSLEVSTLPIKSGCTF